MKIDDNRNVYYSLTCPKLCIASLLRMLILGICSVFFILYDLMVSQGDFLYFWCISLIVLILFRIFYYWKDGVFKAFIIVKIDEFGISNRYCSIKWEDVKTMGVDNLREPNITLLTEYNFGILYYVSKHDNIKNKDFLKYDKFSTIFFPLTTKNETIIRKHRGRFCVHEK